MSKKKSTSGTGSSSSTKNSDVLAKKNLIRTDPDFVNLKRFNHSLTSLMERYPGGVPDQMIADAMMVDLSTVERVYDNIVQKLKKIMSVI